MAKDDDDDRPKKKIVHEIGQDQRSGRFVQQGDLCKFKAFDNYLVDFAQRHS